MIGRTECSPPALRDVPTQSRSALWNCLGRDGRRLRVRGVDMLDGTAILDIKPYLSSIPEDQLRRGWLAEAEARKEKK